MSVLSCLQVYMRCYWTCRLLNTVVKSNAPATVKKTVAC